MDDNKIDQVIASLSRIEHSAEGIKSDTEQKKSQYAQEIERKIKEFDKELEVSHGESLERLAERLEEEKKKAMVEMRADMAVEVGKLDEAYEKNHEKLAREIFNKMIGR